MLQNFILTDQLFPDILYIFSRKQQRRSQDILSADIY
jgi:hypothetical protein